MSDEGDQLASRPGSLSWQQKVDRALGVLLGQVGTLGRRLDASALAHAALIERLEQLEARLKTIERNAEQLEELPPGWGQGEYPKRRGGGR